MPIKPASRLFEELETFLKIRRPAVDTLCRAIVRLHRLKQEIF
jgi:hypothetical protein